MDLKVQFWGRRLIATEMEGTVWARVGENDLSNVRFLYFWLVPPPPPKPFPSSCPFGPSTTKIAPLSHCQEVL